jgi:HK97 family phage prohead protease
MTLEHGKLFRIAEVKAVDDTWEVSGYCSTYGNVDAGGDAVMPGAFDAYIASGRKTRFLSSHDPRLTLGLAKELKSDETGLFGRFHISKTQLGADTHTLLTDGALDSFSIGYIPTDVEFMEDGTRLLKAVDLLEVSIVAVPMNDRAVVTGVKAQPPAITWDDALNQFLHWNDDTTDDLKFPEFIKQIEAILDSCATKAGALAERRAEAERELSEANRAAIKSLLESAGAVSGRLEALIAGPPQSEPAMNLRLELARRRLAQRGILKDAS